MPYTAASAPKAVRKLPPPARRTFIAAFNSAFREYKGDEAKSHATAWQAVKNKYEKKPNGQWGPKTQAAEEEGSMKKILADLKEVYESFKQAAPDPQQVDLSGVEQILSQVAEYPEDNFYRLADLDRQFVAAIGFNLNQNYGYGTDPYDPDARQDKEQTVEADHHNSFPGSLQHCIRTVLNAFHEDEAQESYLGNYGFVLAVYPDYLVTCALDDPDATTADYWKVDFTFNQKDYSVTFGDAKQVDVLSVVVPLGTASKETYEEESAEQGEGVAQNQDDGEGQDFKTENGEKFKKSAYLIIGDPKLP